MSFSKPASNQTSTGFPAHLSKAELRQLSELDLAELFSEIYRKQLWGKALTGEGELFFSGSGSHELLIVKDYLESLNYFIKGLGTKPVIVDLGCGDFNIGSQISQLADVYHACDIVPGLIKVLKAEFLLDNVQFHCLDATREMLPDGDVLVVRQVLQHLSNDSIKKIIRQFPRYRYVIVTEHIPSGEFLANKDKLNGPDSRLRWRSGIDLLQQPFDLSVKKSELLCETEDPNWPSSVIKTILYEMD